ncbi:hypothetical protein PB2503_06962 [Parvularcula bermudensis HTCC2503]|uniref:GlsB/YeaQ/YmgE family stress response membrane protein n=1 Tax=Parvularcula bermudensis (strain ATCC BAA-594 / HTCC2503 / KCTC 12087) TaxID=314260 RepID=E0TE83_PARBH|nr:GlsB/YeaQ/YmgE family stress response membrane protein [Parvularcula bermudensis]ADM09458.1 hypothetical protein PB2503_06962 [Parvularcula bermudensis HTCC2503]
MGIILWIIVGGIAGWLAEKAMKSEHSIWMNIALGMLGAVVLNWLLLAVGIGTLGGVLGQLVIAFLGACLLIWIGRMIRRRA